MKDEQEAPRPEPDGIACMLCGRPHPAPPLVVRGVHVE